LDFLLLYYGISRIGECSAAVDIGSLCSLLIVRGLDGLCIVREQAIYAIGFYKAATNLRKRVLWVGMELEIMCSCVVIMEH